MGKYIETPKPHNKADQIVEMHGARKVTVEEAKTVLTSETEAPVVVVENGIFDAAAFCFSESEFDAFNHETDVRPRTWLIMDRPLCEKLSGFTS